MRDLYDFKTENEWPKRATNVRRGNTWISKSSSEEERTCQPVRRNSQDLEFNDRMNVIKVSAQSHKNVFSPVAKQIQRLRFPVIPAIEPVIPFLLKIAAEGHEGTVRPPRITETAKNGEEGGAGAFERCRRLQQRVRGTFEKVQREAPVQRRSRLDEAEDEGETNLLRRLRREISPRFHAIRSHGVFDADDADRFDSAVARGGLDSIDEIDTLGRFARESFSSGEETTIGRW